MNNKYQNGKIYKIEPECDHEEHEIYYGATTKLLCQRLASHRCGYNMWKQGKSEKTTSYDLFDKFGVNNCKIYLVETFPCNSKEELNAKEGFYIRNNKNINKVMLRRTEKERNVEYYRENCESIKEKVRNFANANKDLIKERTRKYRENNKEEIKEKKSKQYICECGSTTWNSHKSRHFKSQKHLDYLKSLE